MNDHLFQMSLGGNRTGYRCCCGFCGSATQFIPLAKTDMAIVILVHYATGHYLSLCDHVGHSALARIDV